MPPRAVRTETRAFSPHLPEELQDRLSTRIGDTQRLHAELLLDLQGLQLGRFRVHVGIDEAADTGVNRVH